MKIKIDSKKINVYDKEYNSNEEDKQIKKQLTQQISNGNNFCFLISGYRGTGKTTFVKTLEENIKEENVIFIHLNFSKYEKYSLILRKLIREIYLNLSSTNAWKKISNNLVDNIELLYEHTFYEVFRSSNTKKLKEFSAKLEGNYDVKSIAKPLLPYIAIVLSSLNLSFDIIPQLVKDSNLLLLMGSTLWGVCDLIKLTGAFKKEKTLVEELNRKSLYDDEIAEYHLKNILNGLNSEGIRIVFVFDELDKIESESEIEQLIADLKPLLLSNLASFIIVSGQKLYYKFIGSSLLDDSIMASIFSKNIHIPLSMNIHLEQLFNYYIEDKNYLEKELVKNYRDSLILNSYRTVRRFINLISQDIVWENNLSYLHINEENEELYKTDSVILNTVTKIIDDNLEDLDYEDGVKDFLTYQLFVWVKKMKIKSRTYFKNNEVFDFEKNYSEIYPIWCKFKLNELFNELINKLLEIELLEKKEDEEFCYKWTSKANVKTDGINDYLSETKTRFLEDMIEFEKYCREIYKDLLGSNEFFIGGLKNLINELIDLNVIEENMINNKFKEMYNLNAKVKHGVLLSEEENNIILQSSNYVRMLIYRLIEGYCYFVINKYLSKFGYKVTKIKVFKKAINNLISEFDIIAESNELANIIFDIKYRNNYSRSDINIIYKLLSRFKEYNNFTGKQNKFVMFWFSKINRKSFEALYEQFNELIQNEYYEFKDDIYLIYIADKNGEIFSTKKMERYLKAVVMSMIDINNEIVATLREKF
ncbi:ATP-binding protein [Clostridium perfringens]|uniref:ATP-binding protein n=1 Tax=Clostridium perfringens TaxID=1502 RepID=UPI001A30548C|nr:ATP-binding protein [Clostridium perfringens]UUW66982.1 ATP-binding protein [Clostridium perfringens]HAT4248844.1 ATP-binding protein [Clostridium perfringens]